MPLTQQIIKTLVKESIKEELAPVHSSVSTVKTDVKLLKYDVYSIKCDVKDLKSEIGVIGQKVDKLTEIVVDLAGQFKRFDEEQVVLSGHVSDLTDRVEKLEAVRN